MFQPVKTGEIGFSIEERGPAEGGGEVIDDHGPARGEEPCGISALVRLGLSSSVEDQKVIRTVFLDDPPVSVQDFDVVAVFEDFLCHARSVWVSLHAGEADTRSCPGGHPCEADAEARSGLTDPLVGATSQGVHQ
jgi:hypothetical protein